MSVICTVNNFVSKSMKKYEWDEIDEYKTTERHNNVINALKKYTNENIVKYIKEILKGNIRFMCQYDKSLNFETVWSSIFDLDDLTIYRAEGNPRRCKFIIDERLKNSSRKLYK